MVSDATHEVAYPLLRCSGGVYTAVTDMPFRIGRFEASTCKCNQFAGVGVMYYFDHSESLTNRKIKPLPLIQPPPPLLLVRFVAEGSIAEGYVEPEGKA